MARVIKQEFLKRKQHVEIPLIGLKKKTGKILNIGNRVNKYQMCKIDITIAFPFNAVQRFSQFCF